jgi:signal transduction histidine kinase
MLREDVAVRNRVLIVSDDPEFVDSLLRSWQGSQCAPEFAVSKKRGSGELPEGAIAVIDCADGLCQLAGEGSLVIAISGDEPLPAVGGNLRRVVQIPRRAGWADIAAALANEGMLHVEAQQRVAELEQQLLSPERFAALGRLFAKERHGLGNALTSVLGNSELLLMEPGLRDAVRGQIKMIYQMSTKMFESLQRMTSLDMEMQMAERRARRETPRTPSSAALPQ